MLAATWVAHATSVVLRSLFALVRSTPGYLGLVAESWRDVFAPKRPAFRNLGDRLMNSYLATLTSIPAFVAAGFVLNATGAVAAMVVAQILFTVSIGAIVLTIEYLILLSVLEAISPSPQPDW